jgi:hypothetical protein
VKILLETNNFDRSDMSGRLTEQDRQSLLESSEKGRTSLDSKIGQSGLQNKTLHQRIIYFEKEL